MVDLLERAGRELVERPPVPGPTVSDLQRRLVERRRRRGAAVVIVATALITVAGGIAVWSRGTDNSVRTNDSTPGNGQITLACDGFGCHGFDRLPVVPGTSDFYVGPSLLGAPRKIDRAVFEHFVRCTELTTDDTACAKLEGLDGAPLASYPNGVIIGTLFADIRPVDYAAGNTFRPAEMSNEAVRGHDATRYFAQDGNPTLTWTERPGVNVWVAVPVALTDQLTEIANGVQRTPGPTTIPSLVVVPNTGVPYGAHNNDASSLMVGLVKGHECVGYAYIDECDQTIDGEVFYTQRYVADGPTTTAEIRGAVPPEVDDVRINTKAGSVSVVPTPFAHYTHKFFSTSIDRALVLSVDWLAADGTVIAHTTSFRVAPFSPTQVRVRDESGNAGAGHNLALSLITYFHGADDPVASADASSASVPSHVSARTVILYLPGEKLDAEALAVLLGGVDVEPAPGALTNQELAIDPLVRLVVVLGSDHGLEWATSTAPTA